MCIFVQCIEVLTHAIALKQIEELSDSMAGLKAYE